MTLLQYFFVWRNNFLFIRRCLINSFNDAKKDCRVRHIHLTSHLGSSMPSPKKYPDNNGARTKAKNAPTFMQKRCMVLKDNGMRTPVYPDTSSQVIDGQDFSCVPIDLCCPARRECVIEDN